MLIDLQIIVVCKSPFLFDFESNFFEAYSQQATRVVGGETR